MTITIITEIHLVFDRQCSYVVFSLSSSIYKTLFLQKVVELLQLHLGRITGMGVPNELMVTYIHGEFQPFSRNRTPPPATTTGVYLQNGYM